MEFCMAPPPARPIGDNFWQTLFPGEAVPVVDESGNPKLDSEKKPIQISVYPLAAEQMATFAREVAILLRVAASVPGDIRTNMLIGEQLAKELIPIVTLQAFDLLNECCVPKLRGAPHWMVPAVARAWTRQSFLGDRLDPWRAEIEAALVKISGDPSIRISDLWSRFSGKMGTLIATFGSLAAKDTTGNTAPPADTATPKSSTGGDAPSSPGT
jgi:hypothetical protein